MHLVFWLGVLVFYTLYFGGADEGYEASLLFVGFLLPITMATTYFVLYFLIPRYLLTKRIGYFALYCCYTLIGSVYLELLVVFWLLIAIAEFKIVALNPAIYNVLDIVVGMYLVVFAAVAFNALKRWYVAQTINAKLANAKLEAELKLKEAELELLKAQIHPHFLFNTLNNLYGLTLEKSEMAPDVVLHIADMLDYMLYRGAGSRALLRDEVQYIRDYLALEQLRYDDHVQVAFTTTGSLDEGYIAPLLLIPFVENSFKHGISQSVGAAWVCIDLTVQGSSMTFVVENSRAPEADDVQGGPATGIGLKNVEKRLDLLYPEAYTLTIDEQDDRFKITLHLELDEQP